LPFERPWDRLVQKKRPKANSTGLAVKEISLLFGSWNAFHVKPTLLGPGAGIEYDTNLPYWNLGCSMQRNLAAMVEEPADLVQPRGESPAYTARRSVMLEKYRKGEDPTTQYRDNDKAKIADVGK